MNENVIKCYRKGNLIQFKSTGDLCEIKIDGINDDYRCLELRDDFFIDYGFISNIEEDIFEWNNFKLKKIGYKFYRIDQIGIKYIHEFQNAYFEKTGLHFPINIDMEIERIHNIQK